jgi:hypothetical protein
MAWRTVEVRSQKGRNRFHGKGGTRDFRLAAMDAPTALPQRATPRSTCPTATARDMQQAFAATMLNGRTLTFSSLYRPMVGHLAAPQLQ